MQTCGAGPIASRSYWTAAPMRGRGTPSVICSHWTCSAVCRDRGGSSRRARSPLRRLALPVVVAAPSGWPSPSPPAARGSPPGLSGCARGRATARPFCASAVRLRAVGPCGPRASPSSGALAPSRPRARLPPALARCGGPLLALRVPPARSGLRCVLAPLVALAPLRAPAGRPALWSGSRRAAVAPAGPPCLAARAAAWLAGRSSPRGGSRPAARASGGCVPRPRALGLLSFPVSPQA